MFFFHIFDNTCSLHVSVILLSIIKPNEQSFFYLVRKTGINLFWIPCPIIEEMGRLPLIVFPIVSASPARCDYDFHLDRSQVYIFCNYRFVLVNLHKHTIT